MRIATKLFDSFVDAPADIAFEDRYFLPKPDIRYACVIIRLILKGEKKLIAEFRASHDATIFLTKNL